MLYYKFPTNLSQVFVNLSDYTRTLLMPVFKGSDDNGDTVGKTKMLNSTG